MTNGNGRQHSDWDRQREQLSAYLDSELGDSERKQVEAHLVDCAACQRELAELRQVRKLLRALPEPALPRSFTLPVPAEESAAARRSSRPATAARTPARPPRRGGRLARAAQWTGGLAASVGLLLILGSALLAGGGGQSAASNASTDRQPASYSSLPSTSAPSASGAATTHPPAVGVEGNATHTPPTNLDHSSPTATPTDTPSAQPSATNAGPPHSAPFGAEIPSVSSSEVLGLTGAGLAGGGVILFVGGSIGRRRSRSRRRR